MIEAYQLSKTYGGTPAVEDLSCRVQPGRVTGFLGPNGAGKSTTMRMIVGLETPTAGWVGVNGRPFRESPHPMREVGALLEPGLHPGRTARQHLRCLARGNAIRMSRVDEVLEAVELEWASDKRIRGFSLGMRQRLGVGAALLGDPAVLILDEPVNGLDPSGIAWMRSTLRAAAREGRTVLVSSHLMSEMALTADVVMVIVAGRLVTQASIADLTRDRTVEVRTDSPQPRDLSELLTRAGGRVRPGTGNTATVSGLPAARVGDLAAAHGITLHELTPVTASLEDVYLELTEMAGSR